MLSGRAVGDSGKPLLAIQPIEELCRPPCAVCRVGTDGERVMALLAGLAAVIDAASSNEQRGNGAACRTRGGTEVEKKGQRGGRRDNALDVPSGKRPCHTIRKGTCTDGRWGPLGL